MLDLLNTFLDFFLKNDYTCAAFYLLFAVLVFYVGYHFGLFIINGFVLKLTKPAFLSHNTAKIILNSFENSRIPTSLFSKF